MSQYVTGTANVENSNATVIGANTIWSGNVSIGDLFIRVGDSVSYEIANVDSNTEITLSAPYAGNTSNGVDYVITRDFTTIKTIPYINKGDIETAAILKRSFMKIEDALYNVGAVNVTVSSANTSGIRVDVSDPDYGWHDIIGHITPKATGVGSPTRGLYRG